MKMFYFISKAFLFLSYLNLCRDFLCRVGKLLDKKAEVNCKIYDVINWKTNTYNRNIA